MSDLRDFLIGCSFTDPTWQDAVPWSVLWGRENPCFISAKAGMGIKGICTEARYYMQSLQAPVRRAIVILPDLWRYDIEVDVETYLCNAMVDFVSSDSEGWRVEIPAERKWVTSGGLHYRKDTEFAKIFDFLYRHQGFLVILKEHLRALSQLIDYFKSQKIQYHISAIQDPLDQLVGLDYIKQDVLLLLEQVDYHNWIRFGNGFIDKFLNHQDHPNDHEHEKIYQYLKDYIKRSPPND